jgi:DNA polymerase-3 subunit alpha
MRSIEPHAVSYAVIFVSDGVFEMPLSARIYGGFDELRARPAGKVAEYTAECRTMGIEILPPDVNESTRTLLFRTITYGNGLVAVKNIGRSFINSLMQEREEGGTFRSFDDFCERMYGGELNRRAVESLIKCGGLTAWVTDAASS